MALDKSYIDKTDFDVLQPAIDYYERRGNSTDKMRTHYYQGLIYSNGGDRANAMRCWVRAFNEGNESGDNLTKGRICFAQGGIYRQLHQREKQIEAFSSAASFFLDGNKHTSYVNSLSNLVNAYTIIGDSTRAEEIYILADDYVKELGIKSSEVINKMMSAYIVFLANYGSPEKAEETAGRYLSLFPENRISWIDLALLYYKCLHDYEKAELALSKHLLYSNDPQERRYYSILSSVYDDQGKHKEALEAYKKYYSLVDSDLTEIYRNDILSSEDNYLQQIRILKEKQRNLYLCGVLIVFLAVAFLLFKWLTQRQKMLSIVRDNYEMLYRRAEEELKLLRDASAREDSADPDARKALKERIELLNSVIGGHLSNSSVSETEAYAKMARIIDDKQRFMESTRLAFAKSHPTFISYLTNKGLSNEEIEYCCLFLYGLKSKEIGEYLQKRSFYDMNHYIRAKLGLSEHDTNLGNFIRNLFNEC
ncbi:MAG: hypothetical protein HUJ89_00915 [Bacteroidales bacterium]|nr:hypothetical protein [Bacteroidales bacterium]